MRLCLSALLLLLTMSCHAENSSLECNIAKEKLKLSTPAADNIANTFWQESQDGYEDVNRLHIVYTDGSIAVLEHKYCTMYNFEVVYYSRNELSTSRDIVKLLEKLLGFAAIQESGATNAITVITKRLEEKEFNPHRAVATAYDGSTSNNQLVEYSVSYQPIEDSSLHKAALFVYMSIGGEH